MVGIQRIGSNMFDNNTVVSSAGDLLGPRSRLSVFVPVIVESFVILVAG